MVPSRDVLLRGLVAFGVAVVLLTETLSGFGLVRRGALFVAWLAAAVVVVLVLRGNFRLAASRLTWFEWLLAAPMAVIAAGVGVTAWLSPPNSADAMAYHLPRVIYWAQQASVAFFPTPYFNQITLPPMAEYVALHSYVLSGGDRFVNLIQYGGFLGSAVAASLVARQLGVGARGQVFAALFSTTLPGAILQASGAKNDLLLSLWLLASVYFALRVRAGEGRWDCAWMGLALGLALFTKPTAYLFAPALLAIVLRPVWRVALVPLAAGVLVLNGPHFWRNFDLSGSPLGYDSAQGDGVLRWRNEHLDWRAAVSNLLRHTSEQLGDRSAMWNRAVYDAVAGAHRVLGLDIDAPETTFPGQHFRPPRNANHEADAPNRWHLLWLWGAALWGVWRCRLGDRRWAAYACGLAAALLAFCLYLKWQGFAARLLVPLFLLGAPLAGAYVGQCKSRAVQLALCAFLISGARLAVLENWTRPLRGERSVFRTSREMAYFNDMTQWNNRDSYLQVVEETASSGCERIGIDITRNQLEYPFQALLRQRRPAVRFEHVGVTNSSTRFAARTQGMPCAVLCLDCAGAPEKLTAYAWMGEPLRAGQFLLWLSSNGAHHAGQAGP